MDLIMTFDSSAFFEILFMTNWMQKTPFILSDFNDETEEFFFSRNVRYLNEEELKPITLVAKKKRKKWNEQF